MSGVSYSHLFNNLVGDLSIAHPVFVALCAPMSYCTVLGGYTNLKSMNSNEMPGEQQTFEAGKLPPWVVPGTTEELAGESDEEVDELAKDLLDRLDDGETIH